MKKSVLAEEIRKEIKDSIANNDRVRQIEIAPSISPLALAEIDTPDDDELTQAIFDVHALGWRGIFESVGASIVNRAIRESCCLDNFIKRADAYPAYHKREPTKGRNRKTKAGS